MLNHSLTKLANGFEIISCPQTDKQIVYLAVFVKTGSNQEADSERGFAHFTEHLVFKSTKNFPKNSIMDTVSQLGGSVNAFTEYNSTCFYLMLPSCHTHEGVKILAELVRFANFDEEEFATEKGVVIEELYQYQNDPDEWFFENSLGHFFQHANYQYPIIGNEANLRNSTPHQLKNFYKEKYSPKNCFMVAVGDLPKDFESYVQEDFGSWESREIANPTQDTEPLNQHKKGYKFFKKSVEKPQINIIFNSPAQNDENYIPFMLASTILAEHPNSILQKRLKQDLGIADHIGSCEIGQATPGSFILQIFPQKNPQKVLHEATKCIEDFASHGSSHSQFLQAQKILCTSHEFSFESCEDLGVQLGLSHIASDYRFTFEYCQRVQQVTFASLQDAIKKYFADYQIYHMGNRSVENQVVADKSNADLPKSEIFSYQLFKNFKLVIKKEPEKKICGICLSTHSSQKHEALEQFGIHNLCTDLLMFGNQKQDYNQFVDYCQENGFKISSSSNIDSTSLEMKCFSHSIPEALELLSLVFLSPEFDKKHFHQLKNRYLSHLQRIYDYPVSLANELFKREIFGMENPHVHKRGTPESLKQINLKQLKTWHQDYFLSQNFVLSIVGDVDAERIIPACEKIFAEFTASSPIHEKKLEFQFPRNREIKIPLEDSTQDIVYLVGSTDNANNIKETTAFSLLSQIVGGSISSRMFNTLREQMGIAYSCGFSHSCFSDFGYYRAASLVQKGSGEEVLSATKEILSNIAQKGVTKEEMEMSKNYLKNAKLFAEEDPLNIACTLAHLELAGLGYEHFLNREKRIEQTTHSEIQEIAQKYFQNFNTGIYFASPKKK